MERVELWSIMKFCGAFVLLAFFAVSSAKAQYQGCYTEHPSLSNCSSTSIQCTGTYLGDANVYGSSIAQLCTQIYSGESYYNSCESSRRTDIASLNDCQGKLSVASALALAAGKKADDNWALYSNAYAGWVASYKALSAQTKLVTRLRRACGSRCRTIK